MGKSPRGTAGQGDNENQPQQLCSDPRRCGLHFQAQAQTIRLRQPAPKTRRQLPARRALRPGGGFRLKRAVKLYSAYHGHVKVHVTDLGRGKVELEAKHPGRNGNDITVKCIDAQLAKVAPYVPYGARELSRMPATVVDLHANRRLGQELALLDRKPRPTVRDQKRKMAIQRQLNGVDIHFFTWHLLDFLHQVLGVDNVVDGDALFSVHGLSKLTNAYFYEGAMYYGNGDENPADEKGPLGTTDIGAHELGHGLVQMLAGLVYQGHSGALNEHFADVLGLCHEWYLEQVFNQDDDATNDLPNPADWLIGEDSFGQKALRSFSRPEDNQQPSVYKGELWRDPNAPFDYGGVHYNSGVANKCFFELCQKIGMADALQIEFQVFKTKLPKTATFINYRDGMLACSGVYASEVRQCLDSVGLTADAQNDWSQ